MAFSELWTLIRGRVAPAPEPPGFVAHLQSADDNDTIADDFEEPDDDPYDNDDKPSIGGACVIIQYLDSKGASSSRRVTCKHLSFNRGKSYLFGYCHERRAPRQFRVDRIKELVDLATGEVFVDPSHFLGTYDASFNPTLFGWGLEPSRRADLMAALNALVFIARCDQSFHPLERKALSGFVMAFWEASGRQETPPVESILKRADMLAPDSEIFYVSLLRAQRRPVPLLALMKTGIQAVIDADSLLHEKEFHWAATIGPFLERMSGMD